MQDHIQDWLFSGQHMAGYIITHCMKNVTEIPVAETCGSLHPHIESTCAGHAEVNAR